MQSTKTERKTHASPSSSFLYFFSILLLLRPLVPKLTSLMHEPIATHCGGIQHQPTTCSIKYGGVAFKAMLNAPDMGREEGEREQDVQLLSESWGKRGWGAHERGERLRGNCWEEYCNFQIITLPLWLQSDGGRLVAHTDLACVCVWVSARVCFLGWRVVWFNAVVAFHPD